MMTRVRSLTVFALMLAIVVAGCGGPSVQQYSVGEGFDDTPELLAGEGLGNIEIIDCDQPHDNEIYFVADVPGDTFNLEAVRQFAFDTCLAEFETFVGHDYATSILDFGIIYPTEDTWDRADDRQIVCLIYRMDLEQVTGSLRGSNI